MDGQKQGGPEGILASLERFGWLRPPVRKPEPEAGPFGFLIIEVGGIPDGMLMAVSPGGMLHPDEVVPAEHVAELAPGVRFDLRYAAAVRFGAAT